MKKTLFLMLVAMSIRAYSSCQDIFDTGITGQAKANSLCNIVCNQRGLNWNGQWIWRKCGCCG
jgi:hypothetical protein